MLKYFRNHLVNAVLILFPYSWAATYFKKKEIRRFRFRAANCSANLQVFLFLIRPLMSNLSNAGPIIVLFHQSCNELCARDLNSGDKLLRACELSQENVLCESKMILLSLCKRWGVHHMSSGRSSAPANLWAVGGQGWPRKRVRHEKFSSLLICFYSSGEKKENLGIFFFFPAKCRGVRLCSTSFLLDAVGNVGNVFRVGIWTWTSRHPRALNHQAMGESGLASSVFPLAIQAPHPRLKILAMTFFEKQLHLCESFNAMTIF